MNAETQTVVQFIIGQAKQTPGIILKLDVLPPLTEWDSLNRPGARGLPANGFLP